MKVYITGKVEGGALKITQKNKYYRKILAEEYNNSDVVITIEHFKQGRSDAQNRLYWSRYVYSFAHAWNVSPEQAHEIIKLEFNPIVVTANGKTYKIGGSTAKLSISKFAELCNILEEYANDNGIQLFEYE